MNPLLNKLQQSTKIPSRIFRLPSLGLLYDDDVFDFDIKKEGEVEIYSISTSDELNLKNPDYLYSGKALTNILRNCVKGLLKPEKLLMKDIDAILIYIRICSYGSSYQIVKYNHECTDSLPHDYEINLEQQLIPKIKYLNKNDLNKFTFECLGFDITIKMTDFELWLHDMHNQIKDNLESIKNNNDMEKLTDTVYRIIAKNIKSIDNTTSENDIVEWLKQIPRTSFDEVLDGFYKINSLFGATSEISVLCKDCNEEIKLEIQLNPVDFLSK